MINGMNPFNYSTDNQIKCLGRMKLNFEALTQTFVTLFMLRNFLETSVRRNQMH